MDRDGEERILRRAIAKGLIGEQDLEIPGGPDAGRWGARVERLLETGRLDEIAVAAIAEEVAALTPEEAAATMDSPPGPAFDPAALAGWDDYQLIAKLGSGGGGEVFRARDPRLGRDVALKFLHADRPDLAARFRREAQAQARIDHEHVCKVYAVGEIAGRSFIAMQFIEGETFGTAAPKMNLEEKVRLTQQVAEAVHAAHRLGIVHRDLKPGNVMVQRNPDGEWKPWVVDFGLAREMDRSIQSTAGLVGTPAFMAPEQAQHETVDRRSDVYGLGAMLFAVLADRPPFIGSSVEVLMKVVTEEAPPLRRIQPTLPVDLETIVARCLERDPRLRYDSARALAADLGRFLDGEPIQARPLSWPARALRRLRRQRAVATISSAALLALVVLGALWLRSVASARAQSRLAQEFGREAQAVESQMRIAHLLPAHDIRPEKAAIRAGMRALAETMERGGVAAEGPGHYALGRGALALGDSAEARQQLEHAWNSGYRAPEVAYALGQALGEQYEKALAEAAGIEDKQQRNSRRAALAVELREPALAYLRQGRGAAAEAPAFVEGLIAFREDRFDDALALLAQAQRDMPSLYEARSLAGDVYTELFLRQRESGDLDGAAAFSSRAAEAYRSAGDIARSDSSIEIGECARRYEVVRFDWDRGRGLDRPANDALAACDRALLIDPDSVQAYAQKSAILWRVAEVEEDQGKDPRPTLARSVALSNQALERDPRNVMALNNLAAAWLIQGDHFEILHGIDPTRSLQLAIGYVERAIAIRPSAPTLVNLGAAHSTIGEWQAAHGEDPRPRWELSAAAYQRAIALSPGYMDAHDNLAILCSARADYEVDHGRDPGPLVAQAVAETRKAIELKPNDARAWSNLANAWGTQAEWERSQNLDCRASVKEMVNSCRTALQHDPDYTYAYDNLASAWLILAEQELERGQDPSASLREARTAVASAQRLNPVDKNSYRSSARVDLLAARRGPDAEAHFAAALAAVGRATAMDTADSASPLLEAEIRRWRAKRLLSRHQPAIAEIAAGLGAVERALASNPGSAKALEEKRALEALRK